MGGASIRILTEDDRAAFVGHMYFMDQAGRDCRFMSASTPEGAARYAAEFDFSGCSALGCFENGKLVGVAELHPDGTGRAEFAVSVSPEARRRGLGASLTDAAWLKAARDGIAEIEMQCLSANIGLRALLERRGVPVRRDRSEAYARIDLA